MSIIDDIRSEVDKIAQERNMAPDRAFGYWFIEGYQDFSPEQAEEMVIDGPWDHGRDAIYYDDENNVLQIYQFKYSEDATYVQEAFRDIQRGLKAENEQNNSISKCSLVKLYVVSLSTMDAPLRRILGTTRGVVRRWLDNNGFGDVDYKIEVIDADEFRRLWDRIIGINAWLKFKQPPIFEHDSLFGLFDASGLKDEIYNEDLLAFNIRKYLGPKGTINSQIEGSLIDQQKRSMFWKLNNGIVCLCTHYGRPTPSNQIEFRNLTIVNGAQTITTISRYLENNPLSEPIWVFVKVIKVADLDVTFARELTRSSNAQNATNNKDMRAIEPAHKIMKEWLKNEYRICYIFRRGEKADRDHVSVTMKDICQAYVAFYLNAPYVSYGTPSKIFTENPNYYPFIYPIEEMKTLQKTGDRESVRLFLLKRIIPSLMLKKIREFLKEETLNQPDQTKWKSSAYQILWLYNEAFKQLGITDYEDIYIKLDACIDNSILELYSGLRDYVENAELTVPTTFKSLEISEKLSSRGVFVNTLLRNGKNKISKVFTE
ncbi:AIPR family protein [Methanocella arvoryzae]|nr:AIPR family protein [Methanocella arvoryzae]